MSTLSALSMTVLSIIIYLLQASLLPFLFDGITQPDLWLTVIALSTLVYDRKTALILAMIGGLLQDIVISNFFGLHLLPYLAITLLFLELGRERYNRHWYISLLAVWIASLIYVVLSSLIMWWAGSHYPPVSYFLYLGLPFTVMNGVAALFLHPVMWGMKREGEPQW